MPYCIRAEDGSHNEYVFTREDMARMGIINLELLEKLNEVEKND